MASIQKHLRNTFLAGIFAGIPVAVTVFIFYWINAKTQVVSQWLVAHGILPVQIPFLGVVVALAAIYLAGLVATSLIGQFLLSVIDRVLSRIPFLRGIYQAWKHVALTPGGKEGTFAKVVLIPVETGDLRILGFTSGESIPEDPATVCVFVPAAPNPINGRLYFVRRADCVFLEVSPEEALKVILSNGNYIPPEIGRATARLGDLAKLSAN